MYKNLSNKLSDIFSRFQNKKLNQNDIQTALLDIENALIDADVALEAIDQFKNHIISQTQDIEKVKDLDAQSYLMKLIRSALLELLSTPLPTPTFESKQLEIILMVGLQGAGKTTTCAKLAYHIKQNKPNANIMMASADIYRPAAIEQLKVLSTQVDATFHPHHEKISPLNICYNAVDHAKRVGTDVLIIDTAGRLEIDSERMAEIAQLKQKIKPHHTFFVIDSMMGQSALQTAKAFNETVDISGIILSKLDSDTKGGVALSVRTVTQKPIFWCGTGEGVSQLEPFQPERITDQILDMGDIIGLAKKAEQHIDKAQAEKMKKRLEKGQFSLDDMLSQIQQISQLGGMHSILKMLPGAAKIPDHIMKMVEDDSKLKSIECLIQSMTLQERLQPELVRNQKSRQNRILKGSGKNKLDLKQLLNTYDKMKKMADKLKGGKMKAMMKQFAQSGQMPFNPDDFK